MDSFAFNTFTNNTSINDPKKILLFLPARPLSLWKFMSICSWGGERKSSSQTAEKKGAATTISPAVDLYEPACYSLQQYREEFAIGKEYNIIVLSRGSWHAYQIRTPYGDDFAYETAVARKPVIRLYCQDKRNGSLWSIGRPSTKGEVHNDLSKWKIKDGQMLGFFSMESERRRKLAVALLSVVGGAFHPYELRILVASFLEYPYYSTFCGN